MSIDQSRFVSPGAAKAKDTEPEPLSSQPTARGMLRATSAAAVLEVMPLVPVHKPLFRPAMIWLTSSVAERPLATVTKPLVTSTRPVPERLRPPTVVVR